MLSPTDRLLSQLNQTQLAQKDNPVYQVIKQLINQIKALEVAAGIGGGGGGGGSSVTNNTFISQFLNPVSSYLENGDTYYTLTGGGSGSSPSPSSGDDYVVLSDSGLPTPLPVDDGFGNFIYIMYTP